MPGYLEEYGAGDEKRGKILRWIFIGAAAVIVVGAVLYFTLRDYSEGRVIKRFVAALQQKNYPEAYRIWGCTPENPCRDYGFDKFMEDWGPQSEHKDASSIKIEHPQLTPGALGWIRNMLGIQYSCRDGVIYNINFGHGEPMIVYVLRRDKTIGFAPWPVCAPRIQM